MPLIKNRIHKVGRERERERERGRGENFADYKESIR